MNEYKGEKLYVEEFEDYVFGNDTEDWDLLRELIELYFDGYDLRWNMVFKRDARFYGWYKDRVVISVDLQNDMFTVKSHICVRDNDLWTFFNNSDGVFNISRAMSGGVVNEVYDERIRKLMEMVMINYPRGPLLVKRKKIEKRKDRIMGDFR